MEIGFSEVIMIALIIIVLFGPDKIPTIARDLGSGVRKMRGAMEDIKTEILSEADNPVAEIKREIDRVKAEAQSYNPLSGVDTRISLDSSAKTVVPAPSENSSSHKNPPVDPLADEYTGPVSRKP